MAFVISLTVLFCVLVAALLVTCSHLLARVVRLEREVALLRALAGTAVPAVTRGEAAGALPGELGSFSGELVVVSASCASCAAVLDRVCRERRRDVTVVVATEAEAATIDGRCASRVVVSPAIVDDVRRAGQHLPVVLRVSGGSVTGVAQPAPEEARS